MLEKNRSGLFIAEFEAVGSNTQRTELVTCVTNFLCFYSPPINLHNTAIISYVTMNKTLNIVRLILCVLYSVDLSNALLH